jgi:hypothetical protein
MHNFKEDCGCNVFSAVAVEQATHTVVKHGIIVCQIELGKGVRVTARPLDQLDSVVWAMGHVGLLFHSSFFSFSRHRHYKRIPPGKRRKKNRKVICSSVKSFSMVID